MNIVSTCDLYEACYYYVNQCQLVEIEVLLLGKKMVCELSFKGEEIYNLRETCLKGSALVNLHNFKSAYSNLLKETYHAKKNYYKRLKEASNEAI